MFSKNLENISLGSPDCDEIFDPVFGAGREGDRSFIATLRALLIPRMKDSDELELIIRPRRGLSYSNSPDIIDLFGSSVMGRDTIYLINLRFANGDNIFDTIDNNFKSTWSLGFESLDDINLFTLQKTSEKMRFFISEEYRTAVIFVNKLEFWSYHYVQSFIPRILPWYFKDSPINDDEKELLRSLTLKTSTKYEKLIEEFAEKMEFKSLKMKKLLSGFELRDVTMRLRAEEDRLDSIINSIQVNVNQYRGLLLEKEDASLRCAGLQAQIDKGVDDSELIEYFSCNKYLELMRVEGSKLYFVVHGYIDNFDVEMYEHLASNERGYMYNYQVGEEAFQTVEIRRKFMDAIFSDDPLLRIRACSNYIINTQGYVDSISHYDYPFSCKNEYPNPHIDRYSCLGNQRPIIEESIRNGDLIGAIEQCICSAKSINVGESATFQILLEYLFSKTAKEIIELPDGKVCKPLDALKWLESQENNTEVTENVETNQADC